MMHAWIGPIMRTKGDLALGDAIEVGETAEGRFAACFDGPQFSRQIVQLSTVAKVTQAM